MLACMWCEVECARRASRVCCMACWCLLVAVAVLAPGVGRAACVGRCPCCCRLLVLSRCCWHRWHCWYGTAAVLCCPHISLTARYCVCAGKQLALACDCAVWPDYFPSLHSSPLSLTRSVSHHTLPLCLVSPLALPVSSRQTPSPLPVSLTSSSLSPTANPPARPPSDPVVAYTPRLQVSMMQRP